MRPSLYRPFSQTYTLPPAELVTRLSASRVTVAEPHICRYSMLFKLGYILHSFCHFVKINPGWNPAWRFEQKCASSACSGKNLKK